MARDGITTREIAEILEISQRTARAYLSAGQCADCGTPVITAELCPKCAARHATKPRATRAEVIEAIRAWTEETGRAPRVEDWAPSRDPRRKWARDYPRWPSNMTVRSQFGSWASALEAAGQSANRVTWDRQSIIEALRSLAGDGPKSSDLDRRGRPAPGTVRQHFGSFVAALEAAGFSPWRRRWSRAEILDAVGAFHLRHGRLPTERDWDHSTSEHPHASTARQKFGSWRELMAAYGRSAR